MNPTKEKADKAWSIVVRARDGACQACGIRGVYSSEHLPVLGLTAAHIVRRGYNNTRTDEDNGVALCPECHDDFELHTWRTWVIGRIGQAAYDVLWAKARALDVPPVDWPAELGRLRQRISALRKAGV
jgi:hypothetical protein